ncbi:MAG TPA: ABC transporter substrate-binding protein, partial [Stellaceae bacterium]|nr:ABC transporter substrate-binding protein [Stellaceae bacterium]
MRRVLVLAVLLGWLVTPALAQDQGVARLRIGYIGLAPSGPAPHPFDDKPPQDEGLAGALLGIGDNNTSGRFTHQEFALDAHQVAKPEEAEARFRQMTGEGIRLIVTNLPSASLAALAAMPEARDAVFFDAGTSDDDLRAEKCDARVFHLLPSRAMLADALAQYFKVKEWRRILLVTGRTPADQAYGQAMKRALKKFSLKLVEEKPWTFA